LSPARALLGTAGSLTRAWAAPAALWLAACGSASLSEPNSAVPAPEPEPPKPGSLQVAEQRGCPVSAQPELGEAPRLIAPDERVPEFLLATEACQVFDSKELVGKQPFVVVFFASWCSVCEHKIPRLRDALHARAGQLTSLWVTLDDAGDGWTETEEFLERHDIGRLSAVAGRDYLGFSLGYNPFRSVPVVVVVGRSGRVVGVQIGVRDGDDVQLEQALDEAIDQAPERSLFTSFPRP
jgi:hypothetical protein